MRFVYSYKTSENERRDGEISAASRDAVYIELKKRGIRPFRVELAPGLWNAVLSVGKRGVAIVLLALVSLVVAVVAFKLRGDRNSLRQELEKSDSVFMSMTRRQPIGDVAIIEKGIRTGWGDVFEEVGDRFLASFAVPGVPAAIGSVREDELVAVMNRKVEASAGDGIEAQQIKSIVEGMKAELRKYVADGGTIVGYGARLVERQEEEIRYYNFAKAALDSAEKQGVGRERLEALWEARNTELRRMGIRPLRYPEEK